LVAISKKNLTAKDANNAKGGKAEDGCFSFASFAVLADSF
jgi:hypothetical protein